MKKIGFIDYYLDQYHARNYPNWLKEASKGELLPAYAWAKQEKPGGGKTNAECAADMGVELLSSPQEVIEKSDCLIVMSPDNPEMHEELCKLPLASKKPTYVDKTFATDRVTAQRIINMAKESGTPFFSTSALRYANEFAAIPHEGIEAVVSRGPGKFDNYSIHQLEPIVCLLGAGVEKIMYTGTETAPILVLRYHDGRVATMAQIDGCEFGLAISYKDGHGLTVNGATDFYPSFISELAGFLIDGVVRVDPEETLQIMTILEYGVKAAKTPDTWVYLP